MQPPAHASGSAPDPLALLTPVQPSQVNRRGLLFDFLCQSILYGFKGGVLLGAFYGTVLGSFLFPVIGTIFGLGYGSFVGVIFGSLAGLIGGILLGLLTVFCFVPLGNIYVYRWTIGVIGMLVTA
jgi:hypothetical protein